MVMTSAIFFVSQACFVVLNVYLQVVLRNAGYSYFAIGFGMALLELFGMVGPVVTGSFVDRHGHVRQSLGVLMALVSCAFFLIVHASWFFLPLLCCGVIGFCNKSQVSLQDALALAKAEGNVDRYAHMRVMGTLGATFFSLLYGFLHVPDASDSRSIFRLVLVASLPYLLLCFFPHSHRNVREVHAPKGEGSPWCTRSFVICLVLVALSRLAMAGVQYMPLYMVDELGDDRVTLMYACATASEFVAMLVSGKLIERHVLSPLSCMIISSCAIFVRMVLYAAFPSPLGVALAQATHSFCFGFFQPAVVLFVRRLVSPDHQGRGMGYMQSIGTGLMTMVGNLLCGFLVDVSGYRVMFLCCGATALASAVLFWAFRRCLSTT